MDLIAYLSLSGIAFSRHVVGIILKPYQTYRAVAERGKWGELFYILIVILVYFAMSSIVKTASFRPFLLTKQFITLSAGALAGYLFIVGIMGGIGKLWKKGKSAEGLAVAWGYTIIPTALWFFTTSLLYVILPPPRTESFLGVAFSLVYLVISAVLLFWKAELYYLTLRFGLQLDLSKIIGVTTLLIPVLVVYSLFMYKLGIFRVPFL